MLCSTDVEKKKDFFRKRADTQQQFSPEHTHIVHTQFSWSLGSSRGIRQMMEIPSCSSNSHPTPPLLRLGVFTPLIDSLSLFPFQESLSRLSTRLTFPRTLSSSRSRGWWTLWATFPQYSLVPRVDRGHTTESVGLMKIYETLQTCIVQQKCTQKGILC